MRFHRGLGLLLLALPAGCSTNPSPPPSPQRSHMSAQTTHLPEPDIVVIAEDTMPTPVPIAAPIPTAPANVPASIAAPLPVAVPLAANNFVRFPETWVSLEQWSSANGFGTLRRSPADTVPTFLFSTSNGTMTIRMGSQSAFWNGQEYRLGFVPQLIEGHPFVHTLDVQKNFEPLLDRPLRFKSNPVIVIDAGHGGSDNGTANVFNGHSEKEFTLDWARRLQALLVTNGWTVLLTRTDDVNLPLPARVAFAEQHKADLFLSLHFNSSAPDHQQAGLETYCLTPHGMPSNLTRGYSDDPADVFPNNSFDRENLQLAMQLHRAVLRVNGHLDRGVRRARFLGVLQNQNRPAVLVEGGYLSNLAEGRQIADPAYRQKLAVALAQALVGDAVTPETKLISQMPTPVLPAGIVPDGKDN